MMSQLLRSATLCQRLTAVANLRTCGIFRCTSCDRNGHRSLLRYGKPFSVNTAALSQKCHKYSVLRKAESKSVKEQNRYEHFKDLLAIIQKAKTQYYATRLAQAENNAKNQQTKNTASNQAKTNRSSVMNENMQADQETTGKHRKHNKLRTTASKSKSRKSQLEFNAEKPILNEALSSGSSVEMVPQVKTIYGSKPQQKRLHKKKLTAKQKQRALARLLASHPFVEHMQNGKDAEVTPLVIRELEDILQNDSVSAELSQTIHDYLEKAQSKNAAGGSVDELDELSEIKLPETSKPLWKESDLQDQEKLKEVMSNVVKVFLKDVRQRAKQKAVQFSAQRQLEMYHHEVSAYVDACIYTGNLKKAHMVLIRPTQTKKKKGRKKQHKNVTNVNIFNRLMHAYAKQSKLDPVRQLFQYIEENNLEVNLQSYAAVLECLGRSKVIACDITEKVLQDIEKKGFQVQNICHSCVLHKDEWKYIERAIKSVKPDFVANLDVAEDTNYDCNLLNHVNTEKMQFSNPYHGIIETEQLKERAKMQLNLELGGNVMVESIQPKIIVTPQVKKARKLLNLTREKWRAVLREGFLQAVSQLEAKKRDDGQLPDLVPFLKLFPAKNYIDIMMQEITSICQEMESYSPPIVLLHRRLGQNVFDKLMLIVKQKQNQVHKMAQLYDDFLEQYNSKTLDTNLRSIMQQLQNKYADGSSLNPPFTQWPVTTCKAIGRFLMSVIMTEVKIDANMFLNKEQISEIPAFYSITRSRNSIPQEEIMPHPSLVRLHKMAEIREIQFNVADMPSVVPPMPWTSVNFGGNILCTTKLVKNAPPQFDVHEKVPNQQLFPIFDALNTVGSVPWIINKSILDVLIELFNSGGDPKLDIPQPVSKLKPLPVFKGGMTPEERTAVILERIKLKKKQKEMFSLWCTELYRLSIANKYRDEVFWFPHNLDFRSRFYAVPPHFNHLGSDVARGLLLFAKGKELGPDGLDWLKIHLINLTGFKKRSSNRERLRYANENIDKILDSADKPIMGERWWQSSDEPWQTLACCKEIANAMRSPDPTRYVSHFPVHQDGSCNGLQHYAALGRDMAGAQSVNLYPFDSPKDVYSDIVELVEQERKADADSGKSLAQILEGFVRRKVIKQTIMTTVYGVTKYGARQQIRRQLEDMSDFPQEHVWASMAYLTDKTFYCLQQMFTSTKHIQDWFVACAELTSRICYEPVKWVTPVGWPVLQPYFKHTHINKLDNPEQRITIEKPNAMKQKNAFPPNFIHSLDSTHMMLTAVQCFRKGVTFVAVHDCFWTHACHINVMNKVCRQQFVALHKEPILENLADFMLENYGFNEDEMKNDDKLMIEAKQFMNRMLSNLPERGTFDIDKVLESTYFFS